MVTFRAKIAAIAGSLLIPIFSSGAVQAQDTVLAGNDAQVYRLLETEGYDRLKILTRQPAFVQAEGCRTGEKHHIKFNLIGKVIARVRVGTCPPIQHLGYHPQRAINALKREGYSEVTAFVSGVAVIADACKGGLKTQISFNRRGKIKGQKNLGRCGIKPLTAVQLKELLKQKGYGSVVITNANPARFAAEVCRNNSKSKLRTNNRGVVISDQRIGPCGQQFNPRNIVAMLEKQGFSRVEIIDNRRPPYVAHVCDRSDKLEIEIGRFGRLRSKTRIGTCRRRFNPDRLVQMLQNEGYNRIKLVRENRPPYIAEACKGRSLVELTISRRGRIRDEARIGRCSVEVTKDALTARLTERGYSNISINRRGEGWLADVCREDAKFTIRFDAYGDIIRERVSGECKSKTVLEVLKTLESRGADTRRVLIEGCFRGTKYHWVYDRLGNRIGRNAVGECS